MHLGYKSKTQYVLLVDAVGLGFHRLLQYGRAPTLTGGENHDQVREIVHASKTSYYFGNDITYKSYVCKKKNVKIMQITFRKNI